MSARASFLARPRADRLGRALVLGGVFSFVLYGLGAAEFRDLSPLRYTALTAGLGWLSIAGRDRRRTRHRLVPPPSAGDVWSRDAADRVPRDPRRLRRRADVERAIATIGPQNAVLFSNLIPVTTFAIEIARGYRPNGVELLGAGLTVGALVANNLLVPRSRAEARRRFPAREAELPRSRVALAAASPERHRTVTPARSQVARWTPTVSPRSRSSPSCRPEELAAVADFADEVDVGSGGSVVSEGDFGHAIFAVEERDRRGDHRRGARRSRRSRRRRRRDCRPRLGAADGRPSRRRRRCTSSPSSNATSGPSNSAPRGGTTAASPARGASGAADDAPAASELSHDAAV